MKVSDIIQRKLEHFRADDEIGIVAQTLFAINNDSIPICEGKKVIGILTRDVILKKISIDKAKYVSQLKASELMIKKPKPIHLSTSLLKAHEILSVYDLDKYPVVDSDQRLIGVIYKVDVFRALIGQKNVFPNSEAHIDFLSGTYFGTLDWANRFKFELPDLVTKLKSVGAKTILDVGCGTGDYSIELANRGFSVIGIDRNSAMIREANLRNQKQRRKSTGNVTFWNKEAEEFLYDYDTEFDAILFLSNALSHNPNNLRHIIKRASNSLSKNGIMIIQIANFEKALRSRRLLNFYMTRPKSEKVREYAFIEFLDKPFLNKTILKNFIVLVSENKTWNWSGARSILMAYPDEDRLKSILENEGFKKIETFGGNFDGKHWDYLFRKPFNPDENDWLNIVATKL